MQDREHLATQPQRPLELEPERARSPERPPYAVVDIGSNSVRLVVYDQLGRAPFPRFNEKSLCRLAAGLDQTGELSPQGFRCTVEATRRFRAVVDALGVGRIDALATEAVRRATNGHRLVEAIAAEAGISVRILSGAEEARYAALGVMAGFYRPTGLVGDMGGGSLEIAEVRDDQIGEDTASMPLGALPVQELLASGGGEAKRQVDLVLKDGLPPSPATPVFYAVGGGWRAFARVHMASSGAPVRVAHAYAIEAREARAFAKTLWRLPEGKIAALPGVPSRRVRTLQASALIMDRVIKRTSPEQIVFSAFGVREGWLYTQVAPEERYLDPLLEGAQAFGLRQARVPAFAPALARWTEGLFPEETAEKRIRVAACALSDIGWRDDAGVRAAESFLRLLRFPLVGLDHPERVFLAAVVHSRYAGSADDPVLSPAIALLTPSQRRRALILGRAFLLGYRLSGGVPDILANSRLQISANAVRLEVGRAARVPDSEVVADRLNLVARALGVSNVQVVELV
jgi:exopolyphosphatase / guanosine-5'-triphosphate,3'-diphosphate pyrophosphatase